MVDQVIQALDSASSEQGRNLQDEARMKAYAKALGALGRRYGTVYQQYKNDRRPKELEWLELLRQYKGIYDPDVKIDPNNSKVYPKMSRSKLTIVLSRLHEMLFPPKDYNWDLETSPEPRMAEETVKEIVAAQMQQKDPETGQPKVPTADELFYAIQQYADDACQKMKVVIADQLFEMGYSEETKKVLKSGLMYGTGFMKGPLVAKRTKRRWHPTKPGEFVEKISQESIPDLRFTRIWDLFLDMSVTDIKKIEGSFERHILTKHDLRMLAKKRDDFFGPVIMQFLNEHPQGNYVPMNYEIELQALDLSSDKGGLKSTSTTGGSPIVDRYGKKYEVAEYWGYIDGTDLAECGVEGVEDPDMEYTTNMWLLGDRVIKIAVFPDTDLNQYKPFYYDKDETSIYGEGLLQVMRHSQLAVAAAARMVLDNGACVAGPQVEVNWSLLTPDTDTESFYPRKIWYREGKGIDAQYPAVRVYNIDSHIDELIKIIETFKQFGDEETTLPTWMIGQMVNNETAQATSGRLATITVSIKDIVKHFDAYTEQIIQDLYNWNMEFNDRKDIKGDYVGKARGVESLVMKEIRMQALSQLTATMTDKEWAYIPTRDFLEEKLKSHDIDIKLLSEEEVAMIQQREAQSEDARLAREYQKSEIEYKKAQTMAQLSKAKSQNVQAVIDTIKASTETEEDASRIMEALGIEEKMGDIRRKEEAHQQDMVLKDEAHRATLLSGFAKIKQGNAQGGNKE